MSAPVFATVGALLAAVQRGQVRPGDQVACAHCPWIGTTTKLAPHLLVCPDQTETA